MIKDLVPNTKAIVSVTKEFTFDSCHQLLEYKGACARLHGHTYKLQVTVQGKLNDIGMVIDFKELKAQVETRIVERLDHHNLNDKLEYNTTAENMVVDFYEMLEMAIMMIAIEEKRYISLEEVKLWETPTSYASYKGVEVEW